MAYCLTNGVFTMPKGVPIHRYLLIHQNFFFFMTKRQIKTTRTLMPMTAG